jgi:hypothetical protein
MDYLSGKQNNQVVSGNEGKNSKTAIYWFSLYSIL